MTNLIDRLTGLVAAPVRCLACGAPVQDVDEEYCDLCLDDQLLRLLDSPRAYPRARTHAGAGVVSRYDAL